MTTTMFVPGTPAPQGSKKAMMPPRGHRPVLVESSTRLPAWRQAVALIARTRCPQPATGPVALEVEFVMPRTRAMRDRPAPPMVQRPDVDKLLRAVLDGLTGPAFPDDSQVVRLTATKRRAAPGEPTGAHITIKDYPQ
ncbi:RusA family crossover junction endodeoxyribonuclease [Corynebacterium sphenisci]|uniref:RusA family crossover junction endodeoxyribonuclease n=1 Tax=Corynebacterium sphenisci TaxID=191493 RepID=UPI0026DF351F|nr:RusA family crossover junction endodeoxyribonuclease [Corynebacterium sphenisci]MDO5730799.1 RusA family crossover junction endodeoxyribonuclease [Corynebacterium sphenisci]